MKDMELEYRELGTITAALRLFQRLSEKRQVNAMLKYWEEDVTPLSNDEIDTLIEALEFGDVD